MRLTTSSAVMFRGGPRELLDGSYGPCSYEAHFADLFRHLVRPADRCIDVGANVGVHTVRLAKLVRQRGEVIAIEPDPDLARRADGNVQLNRLSNVRVIQAAAADRSASALLYRPGTTDANRARASLLHHTHLTGSAQEVPTVTIDGLCLDPVALIKIDVEGAEAAVVAGAAATITRDRPAVIFEYGPESLGSEVTSPFGWLSDQGYELLLIQHRRNKITGRGGLALSRLQALPVDDGDILAVPAAMASRVRFLVI